MSCAPLTAVVARAAELGRGRRPPGGALCSSPYRSGSWRAQRLLHRSRARFRLLVTGRGVGKTHGCAYELIQLVMAAPPGSQGAVLVPTLTHGEDAVEKLRIVAADIPGVTAKSWNHTRRRLSLPGGRSIKLFSADRKEVVRGPSICAMWVDEGAYLREQSIESSMPALRTRGYEVHMLVSTTPAGKNWVEAWWTKYGEDSNGGLRERFRFKGTESPYNDQILIEEYRDRASPEKFAQEYLAEFVDNLLLAFPERDKLFVTEHLKRDKKPRCWLGVDLGQSDYTVCTLMNEWAEAKVLDRWNEDTPGYKPAVYTAQTTDRVLELLKQTGAALVVDTGGAGPALGKVIAEKARGEGIAVVEIKTSSQGTKAKVVERTRLDVQHGVITVEENEHSGVLDYEMSKFQAIKRILHGQEIMIYEGPQVRGEHDDCVISFCLANWGRISGDGDNDPTAGDFDSFRAVSQRFASQGTHQPKSTPKAKESRFGGFGGGGSSQSSNLPSYY